MTLTKPIKIGVETGRLKLVNVSPQILTDDLVVFDVCFERFEEQRIGFDGTTYSDVAHGLFFSPYNDYDQENLHIREADPFDRFEHSAMVWIEGMMAEGEDLDDYTTDVVVVSASGCRFQVAMYRNILDDREAEKLPQIPIEIVNGRLPERNIQDEVP